MAKCTDIFSGKAEMWGNGERGRFGLGQRRVPTLTLSQLVSTIDMTFALLSSLFINNINI